MNIITLITELAKAVDYDDTIRTWCLQNYGQGPYIHSNWDSRNLPGDDNCPCVLFRVEGKQTGRGVESKSHIVGVKCVISDSTTRLYPGSNNLTEYTGVQNLETFRKKVETVIADIDLGDVLLETLDIDYDTSDNFPKMSATMTFDFTEMVVLGTDPLI